MTSPQHATWAKVMHGRLRCDWCEEAKKVFYVCQASGCKKHACRDCTATGRIQTKSGYNKAVHFLDVNAVNWDQGTRSMVPAAEEA